MTGRVPSESSSIDELEELWSGQQGSQEVRLTRETTHDCWVGRKEKLLRIEQYLSDALKAVFVEDVSKLPEDAHPRIKELTARRLQLRVVVTSAKGKIRRSGDLSSILGEMDLTEVESIEMSNGLDSLLGFDAKQPKVTLRLGIDGEVETPRLIRGPAGVRWKVSGDDRQWVGGTFDWVANEIAKDVPWWSFMRSRAASVIMGVLVLLGALGIGVASGAMQPSSDGELSPLAVVPLAIMYGLLAGLLIVRPTLTRLFPALELIEPGSTPRGRQVLAVVVTSASLGLSAAGVVVGLLAL